MNAELFIQRALWPIQITTVKSIKISRNSKKEDLTLAILNKLKVNKRSILWKVINDNNNYDNKYYHIKLIEKHRIWRIAILKNKNS